MPASIYIENVRCLQWTLKGKFMKSIFNKNTRGKSILYILFALALLSFVGLFFFAKLIPAVIFILSLACILICVMFTGSLIIQLRSGPPW
jgi:high-affinity Fe2+/Pb2+ permease